MKARGFTLVEVLVVLVITSLVSTLLFQVLAQVSRLQSRFGEQLAQSRNGAMRADWHRQVLQGLLAVESESPQRFVGQPRRLAGLTLTALRSQSGAPEFVALEIRPHPSGLGGELHYSSGEDGVGMVLMSWSGPGPADFAYVDAAGNEYNQWPPPSGRLPMPPPAELGRPFTAPEALQVPPQLPTTILLRWPTPQGQSVLVASPRGGLEAVPRRLEAGGVPVQPN